MKIAQYKAYAKTIVKHYLGDIEIDLNMMKSKDPAVIFLRPSGTHYIQFTPADKYPKYGERVKYLFGTADRLHILKGKKEILAHCIKEGHTEHIVYFNGEDIEKIQLDKAIEIVDEYDSEIRRAFEESDE